MGSRAPRIGVSTLPHLFHPDGGVELARLWDGHVEIMAEGPAWQSPRKAVQRWVEALGRDSRPRSLHGPIWDVNLATARYPGLRAQSFTIYSEYLEFAARLDASYLVVHTHSCSGPVFDRTTSQEIVRDALSALAFRGARLGVRIAVENLGYRNSSLFNQEEFCALFEDVRGVVALLDVGHAHLDGWDIPAVIRQLGSSLIALHVHDNCGLLDDHWPVGMGLVCWPEVFDALDSLTSSPCLVLEYEAAFVDRVLDDARRFGRGGLTLERGAAD